MIQINGFTYSLDGVDYPKEIKFPDTICKYYNLSKNSLDAFQKSYLFASHPLLLNDIRDSHYELIKFIEEPKSDFFKVFPHLNNTRFKSANLDEKKKQFWISETSLLGIISLTTSDKCDLMWPHYTQENGFMVKFDTKKLLTSIEENSQCQILGFAPMNYIEEVSQISINPNSTVLRPAIYYLFNIKGSKWNYENEWRLFVSKERMCPPKHEFYPNYSKFNKLICKNRQIHYLAQESINQIVWGNYFISSIQKSISIGADGWIKLSLKQNNKEIQMLLKNIADNYSDRFYISTLRKENTNFNTILARCNQRYEIKVKNKDVFIRATLEYN
jgi:hypothetical protein